MAQPDQDITQLLRAWSGGDETALNRLIPPYGCAWGRRRRVRTWKRHFVSWQKSLARRSFHPRRSCEHVDRLTARR